MYMRYTPKRVQNSRLEVRDKGGGSGIKGIGSRSEGHSADEVGVNERRVGRWGGCASAISVSENTSAGGL